MKICGVNVRNPRGYYFALGYALTHPGASVWQLGKAMIDEGVSESWTERKPYDVGRNYAANMSYFDWIRVSNNRIYPITRAAVDTTHNW